MRLFQSVALALTISCSVVATPSISLQDSADGGGSDRRLGEFGSIAGYEPTTRVTDLALIDLDQRSIETQLKIGTNESFLRAKEIYLHGGHSGAYAVLELDRAFKKIPKDGTPVTGLTNSKGDALAGTLKGEYTWGGATVNVLYPVADDPNDFDVRNTCMVGALKDAEEELTLGCYNTTGNLFIDGRKYSYTYDVLAQTYSHNTIAGLSLNSMQQMYRVSTACSGCPYPGFLQYYEYYLDINYAHHWVQAALGGTKAEYLGRGDADFSWMSFEGRAEAAKKGMVYMNVYMYVLRMMKHSIDECQKTCSDQCPDGDHDCVLCDNSADRAWDEAMALYTGSLEGKDGSGEGRFLYNLADKRCENFRTCGPYGDQPKGTSKVNSDIIQEFMHGQRRIAARACNRADLHAERIWELMAVPLVQGVLHYAHKLDEKTRDGESDLHTKEEHNAEGATFAAAVLPKVHTCSQTDAEVLYGNMRIGATYTDFATVKAIFETNYDCLGITCTDVGGLYDADGDKYFEGALPCRGLSAANISDGKNIAGIVIGAIIGVAVAFLCLFCLVDKLGSGDRRSTEFPSANDPDEFTTERFSVC